MHRSHLPRWFALVLALCSFQCLESLSDDCRKTRTCETAPQLGGDCRWHYPDGGIWEGGPRMNERGQWLWPDGKITATQSLACPPPDADDAGLLGDGGPGSIGVGYCGPDNECDEGLVCDLGLHRCVRCQENSQCADASDSSRGALPFCDQRIRDCVACLNDENCSPPDAPTGLHCKVDNGAPANNRCVECANNTHCINSSNGDICDLGSNRCTSQCTGAGQCSPSKPICNMPTDGGGLCVQCVANTQCSGATPQCNTARKECVPCVDSTVCSNGQVCGSANRCVDCADDSTCAQGTHCDLATNKCVACVDNTQCTSPESSRCNAQHQCAACNESSQCEAPLSVCDTANGGRCVQCIDNGNCPENSVCDVATGACVECVGNADCDRDPTAARCDTATHRCEPCGSASQCLGKFNGKNLCRTPGALGECVECITPVDCAGDVNRSRCNTSQGICSGCVGDGDCNAINGKRACLIGGGPPRCVECTTAAHCAGNANAPACNTTTNTCVECVADSDCTAPGASRCVANQCQPCVNDGGGAHCGHVRNGATVLGVCDTSGGAGVCVECTGNSRVACGTRACNSQQRVCSPFAVGSAGLCEDCVSDAHCAATQRCVQETFSTTPLGFSCFPLAQAGSCPQTPFAGLTTIATIDTPSQQMCLLRRTTCAGFNQSNSRPCTADLDCGEANEDDGRCGGTGLCSLPCTSGIDCPSGDVASCLGGVCQL